MNEFFEDAKRLRDTMMFDEDKQAITLLLDFAKAAKGAMERATGCDTCLNCKAAMEKALALLEAMR